MIADDGAGQGSTMGMVVRCTTNDIFVTGTLSG